MTRPSATCELWLDGARVPDTGLALLEGTPTALDALKLTWGREDPNEQPDAATCSFTILDGTPNPDFLDEIHVGSTVAVWSEGSYDTGTGTVETMDDPQLATWPAWVDAQAERYAAPSIYNGAYLTEWEAGPTWPAGRALRLDPWGWPEDPRVDQWIPPRRFSPVGDPPDAWDDKLKYPGGQPGWSQAMRVKGPAGAVVTLLATFYGAPYATAGTGSVVVATLTLDGSWQTVQGPVPVTANTGWMGTGLTVTNLRATWGLQPPARTWADAGDVTWQDVSRVLVDYVSVRAPLGIVTRRVLVFSGAVTDMQYTPVGDGVLQATFTAADLAADLGNRVIGDEPWPVQSLGVRANRIAELAGVTTTPRVRVDSPLDAIQVSWRDTDAQPAYPLLQDLAQTAGGVLWTATHAVTGPYLYLEDPTARSALSQLELVNSIIVITGSSADNTLVSACDLLEDPVKWTQTVADVGTVAAVSWLEQGTDDEGQPTTTERTETVTDTAGVAQFGTRRLAVSTELVNATDAANLATRLLASARSIGWRIQGLTLDTDAGPDEITSLDDAARAVALFNMLDGTTRMGLGLVLVDMPAWAPRGAVSNLYLEGGTYTFEGGAWTLELNGAPGSGLGNSATWGQLDAAWTWGQWAPNLTWQDLFGVGP